MYVCIPFLMTKMRLPFVFPGKYALYFLCPFTFSTISKSIQELERHYENTSTSGTNGMLITIFKQTQLDFAVALCHYM